MQQKYLFFFALALFITSCGKDKDLDLLLSYDGDNFSAPILDAGVHELGVLFPSSETNDYKDNQLIEVSWFTGPQAPIRTEIIIYGPGSNNTPGTVLYTADVTSGLRLGDWNSHTLATPVTLTGEDLWIVVKVNHTISQQSVGCDSGPNVTNGDWLFSADNWSPFTTRTGESVNWNIRGVISEN